MKKFLFLLLVVTSFNCSNKKDSKSINHFIETFSKGDFEVEFPNKNGSYYFFIKINKNKIAKIYNSGLYLIYKNNYSKQFNDYHSFLVDVYSNDLIINDYDLYKIILKKNVEVFEINNSIQNKNLEDIIKEYKLNKSEEFSTITIKAGLDQKTFNNITYKFFKNQYLVFSNCISGYTNLVIPNYK